MTTAPSQLHAILSNDDGIRAPGIVALHKALTDPHNTLGGPLFASLDTVAPLTVQSATSHGVTFDEPLMASNVEVNEYFAGTAVDGRPADCMKLALSTIWPDHHASDPDRPDLPHLAISGMNAGANCGINTIYSGTVAAALEAAFLGVPAIAVSLHIGRGRNDFDRAATLARRTIETLLHHPDLLLTPHACLNVNIPRCDDAPDNPTPDEPDTVVCPMNIHGLIDSYEKRTSPAGNEYYWSTGEGLRFAAADEGTDVAELMRGNITVTPIHYDLTRNDAVTPWRTALAARPASA